MPSPFSCPACRKKNTTINPSADRVARCAHCGTPIAIPAPSEPPLVTLAEGTEDEHPLDVIPAKVDGVPVWIWWLAGSLVVLLLAWLFPLLTLVGSLLVVGASVAYFCWPPLRHQADRILRLDPGQEMGNKVRIGSMFLGGLLLFGLSVAGLLTGQFSRSADRQASSHIEEARRAANAGRLDEAEAMLAEALAVRRSSRGREAQALLTQVREEQAREESAALDRQADRMLELGEFSIERGEFPEALALLRDYLAHSRPRDAEKAHRLLEGCELVVFKAKAIGLLEQMSEQQFVEWARGGSLPNGLEFKNPVLALACREALYSHLAEARQWRELARLAEEAQRRPLLSPQEQQERQRAELETRLKQVGNERYEAAVAKYEAALRKYEADLDAYEAALTEYEAARARYDRALAEYEAAGRLRVARQFAKSADIERSQNRVAAAERLWDRALDRYKEVIEQYPGTKAAADARELLAGREVPESDVPRPTPPSPPIPPTEPVPPSEIVVSVERQPAQGPSSGQTGSIPRAEQPERTGTDLTQRLPTPSGGFTPAPYVRSSAQPSGSKTVHVSGYYRKNGTYVKSHYRSPPGLGPKRK